MSGEPVRVKNSLAAIAHHEAGHLLVCHYYGRALYGASIDADDHRNCWVEFAKSPFIDVVELSASEALALWPEIVRQALVTARIRFAGPLSQAVYEQVNYRHMDGGQDFNDVVYELLFLERLRLNIRPTEHLDASYRAPDILDTLVTETATILRDAAQRPLYDATVAALLERRVLSERDINDLIIAYGCE